MTKDEHLDKMIRDTKRTVRKLEQLVRDGAYWNKINPSCKPLDLGPERAAVVLLKRHLKILESRPTPGNLNGHNMKRVLELLAPEQL